MGVLDVEQICGGRKGERGGKGVRGEISKAEMRIQKRGHHSDSHLLSFSPSHTCMHARAHARAPICAEALLNISAPIKGDISAMSGCFFVVVYLLFLSLSLSFPPLPKRQFFSLSLCR